MLKIKADVPLVNLIDMGFTCKPTLNWTSNTEALIYTKVYNGITVNIYNTDRTIYCNEKSKIGGTRIFEPKMYDHCIRDLVQKGYVEEVG